MSLKTITLHSHASGPNPWKTAIVLEELGLPYESKFVDFGEIKNKPFTDINPNGRVPAIEDPNTGITLWESGAINSYLVDTYDKEGKLSYKESPEKYIQNQWLMFQVSGQGPYFGQAAWFTRFHHEQLPSAQDRYVKEVARVCSVLDSHLKSTGKPYLVGDKCTIADLAFITWGAMVPYFQTERVKNDIANDYPTYTKWMASLNDRPAVKKVMEDKAAASKQGH